MQLSAPHVCSHCICWKFYIDTCAAVRRDDVVHLLVHITLQQIRGLWILVSTKGICAAEFLLLFQPPVLPAIATINCLLLSKVISTCALS